MPDIGQSGATAGGLAIDGLTKVYPGGARANDGISLHVEPGEVFGLLGPNGAGKTTLVNQVIGLLKPTDGEIRIGPYDAVAQPGIARQLCAYLPQTQVPIESLRAVEAAEMAGRIRGGDITTVRRNVAALFEALQIDAWRNELGARLSGGVTRLVGFVMVAAVPTPLVILDEPTNDVDPLRRLLLWEQVRTLGEAGSAVLLVTHNVLEAERAVDRLAVIDRGRVVAQGTPSSLKVGGRRELRFELVLEPRAEAPDLPGFMREPVLAARRLFAAVKEEQAGDAVAWARRMQADGVAEEFNLGAPTLEDTYVRLVGSAGTLDEEDCDGST